jgi:hypothetical protein
LRFPGARIDAVTKGKVLFEAFHASKLVMGAPQSVNPVGRAKNRVTPDLANDFAQPAVDKVMLPMPISVTASMRRRTCDR